MIGLDLLIIGACCGMFSNNKAQEELAQRQLDASEANEKRARAEQARIRAECYPPKPKKELTWTWPEAITGLRVIYAMLGVALVPFVVAGVQCLIAVLR